MYAFELAVYVKITERLQISPWEKGSPTSVEEIEFMLNLLMNYAE